MQIGPFELARDGRTFVVSEIGINHNGNLDIALEMIRQAHAAGCDAVKFQKRTVDIVYTAEELARPRESPFGTTNGDLKRGLEFGRREYDRIAQECARLDLLWFASPWDVESLDFLLSYDVPAIKIASPCLTDHRLLTVASDDGRPVLLSLGMSTFDEITTARSFFDEPVGLLACTSTYPTVLSDLHLARIRALLRNFPADVIGYSGHEVGLWTTLCTVAMGARIIERHLTLDRSMWGSDQSASVEPAGIAKLVREIRDFEIALGSERLDRLPSEGPVWEKLRRYK